MADFRRWILAFAVLVLVLGSVAPAIAQTTGLNCTAAAAVSPNLRKEGFTELTGDIVLTCSKASPSTQPTGVGDPIPQVNIQVSLSAPVTSRILSGASPTALTDAVLLVDDPSTAEQKVCGAPLTGVGCVTTGDGGLPFNAPNKYNVFQGVGCTASSTVNCAPGPNTVTFYGVPVDPPSTGPTTYRISNIRVDATQVGGSGVFGGSPVYAFVSSSNTASLSVGNPQQTVGLVSYGLSTKTTPIAPVFYQCESADQTEVASVTFTEDFANAFKLQGNDTQTQPGKGYGTEGGLVIADISGSGLADAPTELQTVITNIPPGAIVYVDNWAKSSVSGSLTDATLVTTAGTVPADALSNTITLVYDNSKGTASANVTVVWALTNVSINTPDTLTFNVYASFTAQTATSVLPPAATALSGFSPQASAASTKEKIPTFSSTVVNGGLTPSTLFSVASCQTILLFPYITDFYGFDTGIAISNTSMDSLPAGMGAVGQTGACTVSFFGGGGAAKTLGTSGIYSSTADTSLTNGLIQPGQTWAFSLSSIDAGYNSTTTYGTTGYAIAICDFQYAHGYSFVSDTGIRNFAAAYLALVIPDATRAAQPFTCSENGTSCSALTGEQLVH